MTTYQAQCLLGYLGYDPGGVDGAAGPRTRGALQAFQAASGLPQLGTADEDTCKALVEESARMRKALAQIPGFSPIGRGGCYILCEVKEPRTPASLAFKLLNNRNILIKDISRKHGLDGGQYIRLAVRSTMENNVFLEALRSL